MFDFEIYIDPYFLLNLEWVRYAYSLIDIQLLCGWLKVSVRKNVKIIQRNNKFESYPRHSYINKTPTYFLKTPTNLFKPLSKRILCVYVCDIDEYARKERKKRKKKEWENEKKTEYKDIIVCKDGKTKMEIFLNSKKNPKTKY